MESCSSCQRQSTAISAARSHTLSDLGITPSPSLALRKLLYFARKPPASSAVCPSSTKRSTGQSAYFQSKKFLVGLLERALELPVLVLPTVFGRAGAGSSRLTSSKRDPSGGDMSPSAKCRPLPVSDGANFTGSLCGCPPFEPPAFLSFGIGFPLVTTNTRLWLDIRRFGGGGSVCSARRLRVL